MQLKTALAIAGSDCSGGAGVQADIKTMTMNGVYAMSAITALTAQNTMGVAEIYEVEAGFLEKQLDAVFGDIYPDSVKIGMVSSKALVLAIAKKLREYKARNIVVDPVMVATSGCGLMRSGTAAALVEELLPIAAVVTPNIPEAEALSGVKITCNEDMQTAAERMFKSFGCSVLLKGGHSVNDANDLLYSAKGAQWFCGKRISNPNTHGTGCTLSSAIAANLAKGNELWDAVSRAKAYISGALESGLNLGKGPGPLNHAFALKGEFLH